MSNTVGWKATYENGATSVVAQLCDTSGSPVSSVEVPCEPPVECEFDMQNISDGDYVARLKAAGDTFYYIEGGNPISAPNQLSQATVLDVSSTGPAVTIIISVDVS